MLPQQNWQLQTWKSITQENHGKADCMFYPWKGFILNLLTMTSWSFPPLFVSLEFIFFCAIVCFKKLVHAVDSIEDCSSGGDLQREGW